MHRQEKRKGLALPLYTPLWDHLLWRGWRPRIQSPSSLCESNRKIWDPENLLGIGRWEKLFIFQLVEWKDRTSSPPVQAESFWHWAALHSSWERKLLETKAKQLQVGGKVHGGDSHRNNLVRTVVSFLIRSEIIPQKVLSPPTSQWVQLNLTGTVISMACMTGKIRLHSQNTSLVLASVRAVCREQPQRSKFKASLA